MLLTAATANAQKKFAVKVAPAILATYVGSYTFKAPEDPNQVMHLIFHIVEGDMKATKDR